jgi:nucleotide-binding universal stress UspA family protein
MKRILVGLDGSQRAAATLEAATKLARAWGAKLTLVRAVGLPPDIPQDLWKRSEEPIVDALTSKARSYLEECASNVEPALLDATEVRVGVPWQALCEAAKRDGADLLVIGSHGYGGIDHLLGTTAAKIVNHAPCSVFVVR